MKKVAYFPTSKLLESKVNLADFDSFFIALKNEKGSMVKVNDYWKMLVDLGKFYTPNPKKNNVENMK